MLLETDLLSQVKPFAVSKTKTDVCVSPSLIAWVLATRDIFQNTNVILAMKDLTKMPAMH